MDTNISLQIKRLIEVDKRAVELESKRENELNQLNQVNRLELDNIESQLKSAKEKAKETYELLVSKAQKEAEAATKNTNHKLQEIEKNINLEIDAIASEWWNRILNSPK